ncbi:hypothetical protein [Ekhidna sp.]|uniref:ATP-grasp domain-containing protein n=1 Tax=Ekhidna sp. TaxID=2608089 RepID=UPI00329A4EAD
MPINKKKRLGIIYHSSIEDERRGFLEHSKELYDEIVIIRPERVIYEYKRDSTVPEMHIEDNSLNNLSMVYFLEYSGCSPQQVLLLLNNLRKEGCPMSTNVERFANCYSGVTDNLGKCYELLQSKFDNVRTPSYVIHYKNLVDQTLKIAIENGHFPLVFKPVNGLGGMGIRKLDSPQEAKTYIISQFDSGNRLVLLEQFIKFEREWRVYIADNQIICAYERVGLPYQITKNLSRGGKMKLIDSDFDLVRDFILEALPLDCQLGLYGVDIGFSSRGEFHLIEINTIFLYRNVWELTKVDIPFEATRILYRRARV